MSLKQCPALAGVTLTADTTSLPEGGTTLAVRTIDAAGDTTTIAPATVRVDNLTPAQEDLAGAGLTSIPRCGTNANGRWY